MKGFHTTGFVTKLCFYSVISILISFYSQKASGSRGGLTLNESVSERGSGEQRLCCLLAKINMFVTMPKPKGSFIGVLVSHLLTEMVTEALNPALYPQLKQHSAQNQCGLK